MSEDYLKSPLVVWIQTFSIETITYNDIIDGYLLNEVFQQIDSKCSLEGIVGKVEDVNDRIQNWEVLMKNIRSFYQEVLQQYIIMKPPDIFLICYQPDTATAKDHIDAAILLLLGCAVQCEERGGHIQAIKELHVDTQHSIMQYIKEVTDFSKAILNVNIPLKDIDDSTLTLYTHLSNLINQRDSYIQDIKALHQALNVISIDDFGRITVDGQWGNKTGHKSKSSNRLSLINLEMSNLVGQAEFKAIARRLRQELLDKGDSIIELEDEMEILKKNLQKLKIENFDLIQQARMGKFYRDELDIYKEKAEIVEKLEKEIQKYKDQLIEFEYLKDRVQELQVDNCILMDNKKVLEDQVESLKLKSQYILEAEVELVRCRKAIEDSDKERDEYRERVRQLTQKVESFERENETKKRISYMEDSLHGSLCFEANQDVVGSLADQLLQASQSQIIALETKLQRLELQMEDKFYFSDNVLKALGLDKARIKIETTSCDDGGGGDESNKFDENGEVFLSREDLEKEVLKRLTLLKDESERLKNQIVLVNKLLEQNQMRIKSLETSNIKMTTEKQQLVLNAESSDRKVKNLLEERDKMELELLELKKMADVCLKRTKDLESCLEEVKTKDEAYLQEKTEFEKESKKLKSQLKEKSMILTELENNFNEMSAEIVELRKASEDWKLLETKFHDLETQVEDLNQSGNMEKMLITSLREELVNEKIETQSLNEELARVNMKCESFMSGELVPPKLRFTERLLEEKVFEIENKQKLINGLEESLDEQKTQVERLQSEVNSLLKKEEMSVSKDRTLIVTQRYGQSPGATQEIIKLKENLSKTQRHRDSLLQEVVEMRRQIDSMRSSIDRQQQQPDALLYVESIQAQLQKNQSTLASLQVEHSTILTQNATLESQLTQLKASLSEGSSKMDCLSSERDSLENNCRALQKLHDKLGVEFERLQEDHGGLKGVHRLLKTDLKSAREKISSLEKNVEKMKSSSTNVEVTTLKEENSNLTKAVEGLENDNDEMSKEMRRNRVEIGRLKDSVQCLQKQTTDNRSIVSDFNVEIERLRRIEHMYNRTEEENQILTDQLRMYKTTLEFDNDTTTDNHQQQQKSLIERLSEMKSKSSKNDSQSSKSKKKITSKNEFLNSPKKNQQSNNESKSTDQSDSLSNLRKDCVIGIPLRKSQDDFISTETTPSQSESKTVSPLEVTSKFGDWRIKTVFRKNKSVDSAQQTDKEISMKKKSRHNVGTSDVDDESITLNQFLSECNQSPKSRRKFLIHKRVALDDDVFCDKHLVLDPRPPVVFESTQTLTRCGRSEGSIFIAQDKNSTPPKSRVRGRNGEHGFTKGLEHDGPSTCKPKFTSSTLQYSKSLQDHFTEEEVILGEKLKIRNKFPEEINYDKFERAPTNLKKMNFNKNHLPDVDASLKGLERQVDLVILRKKPSRELQQPTIRRKILTSDVMQGFAVEDVPYHSSNGVVKNLIKSYQQNSESSPLERKYQNHCQKEITFSKPGSCQTIAYMRPKSAGPNQERVNGRRFNNQETDNQSNMTTPRVCMVRPATATISKVSNSPPNLGRNNGEALISKSNSSQKSKALYEYSCV